MGERRRSLLVGVVLIGPALLLLLLVFLWPMASYLWLSFHAQNLFTDLQPVAVGMLNWRRLVLDARFWQDAAQTLRFALVSVSLELGLGLAMALLLNQRWRGRGLVRSLTLLPWALPTTVMALGWRWIFNDPSGPINGVIAGLTGSTVPFLASPSLAWLAVVFADVWKTTPFVALLLLAGLQMIPADLYEALALEGGNARQALLRITLPLLRPYLLLVLLFRLAQALGVFDLIVVLTGGGPASSTESVAGYAYLNAMRFLDFGYSATVMIGMFGVLLLLGGVLLLVLRRPVRA
ncbi:MAG: sugar ABC transporter permease [Synechococcaceae cyanobacterium MAG-AL1]|nr:sugar ABC transporter permease [Candidatus Regnicoccus frigidus MAG-AL1]